MYGRGQVKHSVVLPVDVFYRSTHDRARSLGARRGSLQHLLRGAVRPVWETGQTGRRVERRRSDEHSPGRDPVMSPWLIKIFLLVSHRAHTRIHLVIIWKILISLSSVHFLLIWNKPRWHIEESWMQLLHYHVDLFGELILARKVDPINQVNMSTWELCRWR